MLHEMTSDGLKTLISKGECRDLEFKKSSANLRSGAETLCAFLNGTGGSVLIGVTDKKQLIGQHVTDQTRQEIANTLRKFEPTANIEVHYINIAGGKFIIVFTAHPDAHSVPYTFDGRAYERKESATHTMSQNRYQQLLLARNITPISWEAQPALGMSIDDLDYLEILNTAQDINRKRRSESIFDTTNAVEILTRLKLLEYGQLTNAAVVLFAKEIPGNYLQCVVRMARFRGTEKANFIDSRNVFGNAFQLLKEAETFINRHTSISSHFEKGQLARIDEPEYPTEAVREALINGLCHRDYASAGGSITVTIYDDRLEIINTGLLPRGISIADLKKTHTSHPRNLRISNVFFRRGFIETLGIGTQLIVNSCATAKMKEPEFYEQAGSFVVRMWSKNYQETTESKSHIDLTTRQKHIIEILTTHQKLSPHEILGYLADQQVADRTLRRDLQVLKEKKIIYNSGRGPKTKWYLL